jgi:hypothetical protein
MDAFLLMMGDKKRKKEDGDRSPKTNKKTKVVKIKTPKQSEKKSGDSRFVECPKCKKSFHLL